MAEANYKRSTISGMFWRIGERVGAQSVSAIVGIVLARLLGPADYGVIALTAIFITICDVFVTSGFGTALVQKKDTNELDYSSVFYAGLAISLTLYFILFFTSPLISDFYGSPLLCPILRVMGLRLPISALGTVQYAYVSKKLMFRSFFIATAVGTVISAFVGIWMAYNGYGAWALVGQQLTNIIIDKIMLMIITKWHPHLCFSWNRVKGLLKYGWNMLASGLLDTGYNELRSLIIGKKYSSTDLAFYNKGKAFPSLIGTTINSSIGGVLFPVMSAVQDEREYVKSMTRRSVCTSCYLIFPVMMGLAVTSPTLVPVLYTSKWNECIPYLQMMCFVYAFWPVQTTNLQAIKAMGRSDIFLKLEIIKKIIGLTLLFISMWFGVFWMVFSQVVSTVISTVINAYPNKRLLNYSWGEQMKDLLPYMSLAVVMGIPVYLISFLPINMYLLLAVQVVIGIVLYMGMSFLFKIEEFTYLISTIKEMLHGKNAEKQGDN